MTQTAATEIMVTGRLVAGHPMKRNQMTDDKTGQPIRDAAGQVKTNVYIGVAVPKTQADWKLEPWGQQIVQRAQADWPNGEHGAATFAWKVTDGDSAVPNKAGNKPCDKEGYPGHWVINGQTMLAIRCHHVGKYQPHEQIQDENEIKTGDYCRVLIGCRGNNPSQSPGVYMNPELFELSRAGQAIITQGGPSAADVFGGSTAQLPPNAALDTAATTPPPQMQPAAGATPPPPPAPANDLVTPPPPPAEERYEYSGQVKTKSEWLALPGYTEAHLAAMTKVA